MKKGGYQIIDLQGKELLASTGMVYEGIYDKIEGTKKALLISGINFDGAEYHDTFATPEVRGSAYLFNLRFGATEFQLQINDNDVVQYDEI